MRGDSAGANRRGDQRKGARHRRSWPPSSVAGDGDDCEWSNANDTPMCKFPDQYHYNTLI
jgi:hypothetical protein